MNYGSKENHNCQNVVQEIDFYFFHNKNEDKLFAGWAGANDYDNLNEAKDGFCEAEDTFELY